MHVEFAFFFAHIHEFVFGVCWFIFFVIKRSLSRIFYTSMLFWYRMTDYTGGYSMQEGGTGQATYSSNDSSEGAGYTMQEGGTGYAPVYKGSGGGGGRSSSRKKRKSEASPTPQAQPSPQKGQSSKMTEYIYGGYNGIYL